MLDGAISFSEHNNKFYDEFGNRINNYLVEKYSKCGNEWKLEQTYTTYVGSDYVVDGKLYFKGNSSLIPLNMDFNSESCRACYKIIGKDTEDYKRIIGNEYLCKSDYLNLRLHRQDYSNGTCFYTLQDNRGDFRPECGSNELSKLISVLERTIDIDKKYIDSLPSAKESIEQTKILIENIKQFI